VKATTGRGDEPLALATAATSSTTATVAINALHRRIVPGFFGPVAPRDFVN
jgi:hypothetical protein